jgi:hypothetical protein
VEVQPQLVRARVPHDVRGRDMADGVVGLPTVGDDRVVGVFGERPFQGAGCGGRERGGESTDSDGGAGGGAGAQEQAAVETRLGHGRLQGEVTVRGRWPR